MAKLKLRGEERRPHQSPHIVDFCPLSRVVVDGVVHFLLDNSKYSIMAEQNGGPKHIASFNPLTEEWRVTLEGPPVEEDVTYYGNLSLVSLSGC